MRVGGKYLPWVRPTVWYDQRHSDFSLASFNLLFLPRPSRTGASAHGCGRPCRSRGLACRACAPTRT
eukprot:2495947-Alexandrium_andersonii.AAC.1